LPPFLICLLLILLILPLPSLPLPSGTKRGLTCTLKADAPAFTAALAFCKFPHHKKNTAANPSSTLLASSLPSYRFGSFI
jgi:hypothetical protein